MPGAWITSEAAKTSGMDAKYGTAVEILDLAKRSGADVLGIMKNKDKKTPTSL